MDQSTQKRFPIELQTKRSVISTNKKQNEQREKTEMRTHLWESEHGHPQTNVNRQKWFNWLPLFSKWKVYRKKPREKTYMSASKGTFQLVRHFLIFQDLEWALNSRTWTSDFREIQLWRKTEKENFRISKNKSTYWTPQFGNLQQWASLFFFRFTKLEAFGKALDAGSDQ